MLLSYRDPQFWKEFHTRYWRPQLPTVIRQPFRDLPFSEDSLLRAMKAFEIGLRGGDQRSHCLVSVDDSQTAPRRPLRQLFRSNCDSLAGLEQNCARVFPKQRFGLMVTHFENVDPGIWDAITAFLQDARRWIDFPVPRAFLDLFYGNYLSSFTGLHKDTQEIFAFVIRGEKRILAWPFDYFLSKVKGLSPGARYFHMRLPIDHRKYRKDAVVLDAQPGDVIYWPSDHWHVAEAQHGSFSAMISLGLFRQDFAPTKLTLDQQRFRDRLLSRNSLARRLERSALRSQEMTEVITSADAAGQLRWVTGFGFELGGPIVKTPPGKRIDVPGNVTVIKKKNSLLLWKVDRLRRRILVAANGHSITLPHSSELTSLLERIARGESVSVPNSLGRPRGTRGSKMFETNWNRRCQLRTRRLVSYGNSGGWLVDWLLRVYAVEHG